MKPTVIFLAGLIVGMALWAIFLANSGHASLGLGSPISPLFCFVIGLFLAVSFFSWVAKFAPKNPLAQGNNVPWLHRQVIFIGGFVAGIAYLYATR
jgi:hypothetical protein